MPREGSSDGGRRSHFKDRKLPDIRRRRARSPSPESDPEHVEGERPQPRPKPRPNQTLENPSDFKDMAAYNRYLRLQEQIIGRE